MRTCNPTLAALACGLLLTLLSACCGEEPPTVLADAADTADARQPDAPTDADLGVCLQDPQAPCNCFQQMTPTSVWDCTNQQDNSIWLGRITPDELDDNGKVWMNTDFEPDKPDCMFDFWNLDTNEWLHRSFRTQGINPDGSGVSFSLRDYDGRPNAQARYKYELIRDFVCIRREP